MIDDKHGVVKIVVFRKSCRLEFVYFFITNGIQAKYVPIDSAEHGVSQQNFNNSFLTAEGKHETEVRIRTH